MDLAMMGSRLNVAPLQRLMDSLGSTDAERQYTLANRGAFRDPGQFSVPAGLRMATNGYTYTPSEGGGYRQVGSAMRPDYQNQNQPTNSYTQNSDWWQEATGRR